MTLCDLIHIKAESFMERTDNIPNSVGLILVGLPLLMLWKGEVIVNWFEHLDIIQLAIQYWR